jgi:lactate dehydrogenase-like 2-hydroxyacid dehydrogenase
MTDILLAHPNMSPIRGALAPRHEVHALWEYESGDTFLSSHGGAVSVIVTAGENRIDTALLGRLTNLRLIVCVGSGYDGVDVDWCARHGIAVVAAVGANAKDVADHALGLAIAAWRGIVADHDFIARGEWQAANRLPSRRTMTGVPAGIVGLGSIGRAVAHRLSALDMPVQWWGPREQSDAPFPKAASLIELAAESRLLVLCCRADASSHHLVDAAVLEALGPDGVLVNVARGSVVDEDALIAALRDGRLAAAGLDVFATEPTPADRWRDVPNVVLTPHAAGLTTDTLRAMIGLAVQRIDAFLLGDEQDRGRVLSASVAAR